MRTRVIRTLAAGRLFSLLAASAIVAATSSVALAQNTAPPPPAREAPRPQDIDPAVNTSAPAAAPAQETPRPQDIDPAVNTSSPAQSGTPTQPAPSAATAAQPGTPAAAAAAAQQAGTAGQGQKPAARGKALDRLELDTTQITGNRELPKVLYIVPWKRSDLGDLVGRPVNSLLDEVLAPVDRDVFKRENRYYRALTPGAAENDALSAGADRAPGPTRSPTPTNSAPAAGMPGSATAPRSGEKPSTGSGSAAPATGNER
jgi:hypothetical protein